MLVVAFEAAAPLAMAWFSDGYEPMAGDGARWRERGGIEKMRRLGRDVFREIDGDLEPVWIPSTPLNSLLRSLLLYCWLHVQKQE